MIEVYPQDESGSSWGWRETDGDGAADGFENRRDAIAAARKYAGAGEVQLVEDGKVTGTARREANQRIVLVRYDGSEVGELDRQPSTGGGPPQVINLTPASEASDAGLEVNGG